MTHATSAPPRALLDTARAVIEAFNAKDWDRARATITPDFDYDEVATGRRLSGADAALDAWRGWAGAFPDSKGSYRALHAAGDDTVTVEVTWSGTHLGPLHTPGGAIQPTGRSIAVPACVVFEIANGKARAQRHYFDMVTLLRQLGAMP